MSPPSCRLFSLLAQGKEACFKTNNIRAGTNSCHNYKACREVSGSIIENDSCHGDNACNSVQSSIIHDGSCYGGFSCYGVQNANIGKGSCNYSRGDLVYSEQRSYSCEYVANVKIGNNSCNGNKVCYKCKHYVPNNSCNQGITDDMDIHGNCNYCKNGTPNDTTGES